MLHHSRAHQFVKLFSTSTPKAKAKAKAKTASVTNWRTKIKEAQLVHEISSSLLQRHNWPSLLQNLNLSSKLTPWLVLQILRKTQHNPQVTLDFFYWIQTNLHLQPDIKSQCHIILLLLRSGQTKPIKPILDSLIQTHTAAVLAHSMIQLCEGRDSQSDALSLVFDCYSRKGLFMDGLNVHKLMRVHGFVPSISACNALLDTLCRRNEMRLGWCFYGAMIRDGLLPNKFTWALVAQILCRRGKFQVVLRLLDLGIYNSVMYNLVIDFYSKSGNFKAAFERLNEMCDARQLTPGFSTYSSILDGACKYKNVEVIDEITGLMVENEMLPKGFLCGSDLVIQKLCGLGKTYAAEIIFKGACDKKTELQDDTYGCMFWEMSKEGRVKEAIQIYHLIIGRGITVKDSGYHAFANLLCNDYQTEEGCALIRDVIKRGYSPCAMELSKFVASQCGKGRWREVEDLLDTVLERGILLDSFCCCSLMEHYCSNGQIDKAIALHSQMEKLQGSLDVATYDVLLDGLFKYERMEEAVKIFDYMMKLDVVSSSSFVIMICRLCHVQELRKAMKIHDEMLKMGYKPDEATYKKVITGFT